MQNARYGYMEADVLPLNYSRPWEAMAGGAGWAPCQQETVSANRWQLAIFTSSAREGRMQLERRGGGREAGLKSRPSSPY
jgi:hypothetical protein